MNFDKWEVVTQELVGEYAVKVYLIEKGVKPRLASIGDGGFMVTTEIKDGKEMPPTLRINYDVWKALKSAMLDKQEREKSTVEAELGATKYHLEDMRKLVKGLL